MNGHATKEQFIEALRKMADEQKLAVTAAARYYASGNSGYTSGDDLLSEVVVRVGEGRRNWPMEVAIDVFLANAMRSVASATRQRADMSAAKRVSLEREDGEQEIALGFHPSAEEEALKAERGRRSAEAIAFARRTLRGDLDGINVLEAMAAGLAPKDMREAFGMEPPRINAARQRVMSRLDAWKRCHPE